VTTADDKRDQQLVTTAFNNLTGFNIFIIQDNLPDDIDIVNTI